MTAWVELHLTMGNLLPGESASLYDFKGCRAFAFKADRVVLHDKGNIRILKDRTDLPKFSVPLLVPTENKQ